MEFQFSKETSEVKESKILVYMVCVYIITWYLQLGSRVGILDAVRFEFLLGMTLSAIAFFRLMSDKASASPLRAPVLIWLFLLAIYTIFSQDRSLSWNVYFNRVIKFSMMALFISVFIRTEWALKMVIAAFLLAMLKLGQEGVFGWLTGGLVWQNQGIMRLHGSTLLYRHPNSFSGMAVGCLPFIFYLFPVVSRLNKLMLLGLLGSCLIIILFTGSRTGYVATCMLAAYFWRDQLKKSFGKALAGLLVVMVVVPFVVPDQYVERFKSIYTMEEAEGGSSSARLKIIDDAIAVFSENPLGVGVGAFPVARGEMFGRFQDTHNMYLELLTNLSVFGLFAFLVLIFKIVKTNSNVIKTSKSKFLTAMAQALIAFVYARLFLGVFGMDTYEIYWWFAVGLTVAVHKISGAANKSCSTNGSTTTS